MCWAAARGDLDSIQHMVARGYDTHCSDYDGRTPVHLAAAEGHLNIVQYLINKGCNLNAKDRWGRLPVDDAKQGEHKNILDFIAQTPKKTVRKTIANGVTKLTGEQTLAT